MTSSEALATLIGGGRRGHGGRSTAEGIVGLGHQAEHPSAREIAAQEQEALHRAHKTKGYYA